MAKVFQNGRAEGTRSLALSPTRYFKGSLEKGRIQESIGLCLKTVTVVSIQRHCHQTSGKQTNHGDGHETDQAWKRIEASLHVYKAVLDIETRVYNNPIGKVQYNLYQLPYHSS